MFKKRNSMDLVEDITQKYSYKNDELPSYEEIIKHNSGGFDNTAFQNDNNQSEKSPKTATTASSNFKILDPKEKKRTRIGIMKNVIVISFAFLFLFTAYNAMANLQSSINAELGTTSLAVLYSALVVSCAFLPALLISKLTVKITIAVCMLGYSAYMVAQFAPSYYTMIPGAILLGIGAAPMWSAKCTYLTEVGRIYADITGQDAEVIITRLFGVFFLVFQSSQIWGNLISSAVLSIDADIIDPDDPAVQLCGINYCATDNHTSNYSTAAVSDNKRYTLSGIYLGCALLASVIVLQFVDPLARFSDYEKNKSSASFKDGVKLLGATFMHLMHPYQLLIIPLTIWSGVEQAFIQGDFTSAFVSCGLGVHMVGYVMICYGISDALCSITFSPMVKLVGRIPVFLFGCAANVAIIVLFMKWHPNSDDMAVFFVAAAIWGVADAVWQTQINAFYGVIFPGQAEAAFSNYRMWESIGFIITFITNSSICVETKLYIVIGFLSTGMVGYLTIEILEKLKALPRGFDGHPLPLNEWRK